MTKLFFKKYWVILFLLHLSIPHSIPLGIPLGYSGEKQLYLFGGGGDPEGEGTIFDDDLEALSRFSNEKNTSWKTKYTFDGGHSVTESKLRKKFKKENSLGDFTEENFHSTLMIIQKKMETNELKSGDQLLLVMDSHGAPKSPKEKSHMVFSTSEDGEKEKKISMDDFEKIANLAKEKGVKLALLDLSCYSGNTLKIKNKDICIISGTGENEYGYSEPDGSPRNALTTFEGRFLDGMKSGENLENLFLKSRLGSVLQDFPMISTDSGIIVNDLIYKMLSPYFIYNDDRIFDFSNSYNAKNIDDAICKTQNEFSEIKKRINEMSNISSISKNILNTTGLGKALDAYRAYQLEFEKVYSDSLTAANEVKETILRDYPNEAELFNKEEGISILSLTVEREKSMAIFKEQVTVEKNIFFKSTFQKMYDDLARKNEICKDISGKISTISKEKIEKFKKYYMKSDKTDKLAEKVAIEAKTLYDNLYRTDSGNRPKNNPCKDFVL